MKKLATVFVAFALFAAVTSTRAVTYTGNTTGIVKKEGTQTFKASATFVVSNLELVITLSDTGTFNPKSPADILTGLFFNFVQDPHLTPVSATVAPGDSVIGHRLPLGFDGNVGGEWGYTNNLSYIGSQGTDNEGISATKLKWFKKQDLFPGGKIPGASPLGGAQFGITTLSDLGSNNQGGTYDKGIESTVVFVLDLPSSLTNLTSEAILADISDVNFQWGTSIKKGFEAAGDAVAQIPEPSTVALVLMGLAGAVTLGRSKIRRR
jgi:hypothetical protein